MKKQSLQAGKSITSRILGIMLSLVMVFSSAPITSYATDEEPVLKADEAVAEAEADEVQPADGEGEAAIEIEINQGLSKHVAIKTGDESLINEFVARKQTAVMFKIPGSESASEAPSAQNYKLEAKAVTNGQEADSAELTADGSAFTVQRAYTKDCDLDGWYAVASFPTGPDKGSYNFHIYEGDKEIATRNGVTFYETNPLNVLLVPVKAYYSASFEGAAPQAGCSYSCLNEKYYAEDGNQKAWSELKEDLKKYLLDTYPLAEINIEEAQELDAGTEEFDMVAEGNGQKNLWDKVNKLQSKNKEGKNRYDMILAFVLYRQDKGTGQGYTFGRPTNIITYSDKDMFPTVAHEIAHCYQVGDEYNGGSLNNDVNPAPNGYKGRNFVTGEDIASNSGTNEYWQTPLQYRSNGGSKKNQVNGNGEATMVYLNLHPYSLSQKKFICWAGVNPETAQAEGGEVSPTISWMGSGFTGCDGYYWTTAPIWDQLFKQFVKKEKQEAAPQEQGEETSNAQVYLNSLKNEGVDLETIFAEDDFYYDDDYRWGDSRMVEVEGWLDKAADGSVSVNDMSPMFSYEGDLEFIEPLEDIYKNSGEVYSFIALDNDGKAVKSPVDEEWAACEFFGGFFNASTGKMQKEKNFQFDAEYPEGTAEFVIVKGKAADLIDDNGNVSGTVLWKMSDDPNCAADLDKEPEGYLTYADVNEKTVEVEWEVEYNGELYDGTSGELYTEVYYYPEGDDGQAFYVGCSADDDWTEGYVGFETDGLWSRNAYVWIKVTNGVNAYDIYSDELEVTLCNSKISLSGAGITKTGKGEQTCYEAACTGNAICPKVAVKAWNPATASYISLKQDVDYSVSYEDNVEVGFATVTVQGIGLYAGKNTQEFEIIPKDISKFVPEAIPNLTYSSSMNSVVMPYLNLRDSSNNQLVNGKDFTVKFNDKENLDDLFAEAPGSAVTVTVSYFGKGNYTGNTKKTTTFDVVPASQDLITLSQNGTKITLKAESAQYTGRPIKLKVKSVEVTDAEGKSVKLKSANYKLVYSNNVSVGTARVTVVGKKGCVGSAYTTFEIKPREVKKLTVSGVKDQPYGTTVDVKKLPIVVKAGGITLTRDVDYKAELKGDTTKVTGKGDAKPEVVITLITAEDAKKDANGKKVELPKVCWSSKAKSTSVSKSFSIVKVKLNSPVVSIAIKSSASGNSASNNTASANQAKTGVVKIDGKEVGTIRSLNKSELTVVRNKYVFEITGTEDVLPKGADLSEAVVLKALGKELNAKDYTISVSKAKNGKIGTITIKANKDGDLKGKKVYKFLYTKAVPETAE
ncbi:MAG: hypothetical protein IK115_04250 [Lachnospiraceae bacterium]|nr:hypothetical protein [Lachnospiraceae bacterium]